MPLTDQRAAPMPPQCIEPGCDRPAAAGDERCELHLVRLGARPSRALAPASAPPLVVVETALDASVAVPPAHPPRARDLGLAMGVWALGFAGFCGFWVASASLQASNETFLVFLMLLLACGGLATYGAAWIARKASLRALRWVAWTLLVASAGPTLFAALLVFNELAERFG